VFNKKSRKILLLLLSLIIIFFPPYLWARRIKSSQIEFLTLQEIQAQAVNLLNEVQQIADRIQDLIQDIRTKAQAGIRQEELQPEFEELNNLYVDGIYQIAVKWRYLRNLLNVDEPAQRKVLDEFLTQIASEFNCDKCLLLTNTESQTYHLYPFNFSRNEFEEIISDPNAYIEALKTGNGLDNYGIEDVISGYRFYEEAEFSISIFGLRKEGENSFNPQDEERFSQIFELPEFSEVKDIITKIIEKRKILDLYSQSCAHALVFPIFLPSSISGHEVHELGSLESTECTIETIKTEAKFFTEIFSHPLEPEIFSPVEEIENVIYHHLQEIKIKGLQLITNLPQQAPSFDWQRGLFAIVIDELLRNAVKYTDEGTITVSFKPQEYGYWVLEIKDTGIGIPQEALDKIFASGYRGSNVSDIPGTGEGLSLSFTILHGVGGKIEVESQPGAGTTFRIYIPSRLIRD
jgi:signal transduction histidine kinase